MLKTPINKKNGSAKAMRSASEVSQFDRYGFGGKAEGECRQQAAPQGIGVAGFIRMNG